MCVCIERERERDFTSSISDSFIFIVWDFCNGYVVLNVVVGQSVDRREKKKKKKRFFLK